MDTSDNPNVSVSEYTTHDSVEKAHERNMDKLTSDDPSTRATAKFYREFLNLLDRWMDEQLEEGITPKDLMGSGINISNSIYGTILTNIPPEAPPEDVQEMADGMKEVINEAFDEVVKEILARRAAEAIVSSEEGQASG